MRENDGITGAAAFDDAIGVAEATEVAEASDVSDDELPHNSRTVGETGWA